MKLKLLDDMPDIVEALSSDTVSGTEIASPARHGGDDHGEVEHCCECAHRCHPPTYRVMVECVHLETMSV